MLGCLQSRLAARGLDDVVPSKRQGQAASGFGFLSTSGRQTAVSLRQATRKDLERQLCKSLSMAAPAPRGSPRVRVPGSRHSEGFPLSRGVSPVKSKDRHGPSPRVSRVTARIGRTAYGKVSSALASTRRCYAHWVRKHPNRSFLKGGSPD